MYINLLRDLSKLTKWKQSRIIVRFAKFRRYPGFFCHFGCFGSFWLVLPCFKIWINIFSCTQSFRHTYKMEAVAHNGELLGYIFCPFGILATFRLFLAPFEQCYQIFHIFTPLLLEKSTQSFEQTYKM